MTNSGPLSLESLAMALNIVNIDITLAKDLPYYAKVDFYYAVVKLEQRCPHSMLSAINLERLAVVSRQELEKLLQSFLDTRSIDFLPQVSIPLFICFNNHSKSSLR